jgi:hypothetical protein
MHQLVKKRMDEGEAGRAYQVQRENEGDRNAGEMAGVPTLIDHAVRLLVAHPPHRRYRAAHHHYQLRPTPVCRPGHVSTNSAERRLGGVGITLRSLRRPREGRGHPCDVRVVHTSVLAPIEAEKHGGLHALCYVA